MYIPAQYFGFFIGVVLTWWFTRDPYNLQIDAYDSSRDQWHYSEAVGMETVGALMFVLIYLNQTSAFTRTNDDTGLQ